MLNEINNFITHLYISIYCNRRLFNITLIAISLICNVVAHNHQLSGRVAISKFCFVNIDNYDNLKKKTIWENSKVPTAQAGTRKLINFTEYFYWILRISIVGGLIFGFTKSRLSSKPGDIGETRR